MFTLTKVETVAGHFRADTVFQDRIVPTSGGRSCALTMDANWLQERHRRILRGLALRLRIAARIRSRFDESDVVHEALLKAHRCRDQYHGQTEAQLLAWLAEILRTTFLDMVSAAYRKKCDPNLEQSIRCLQDSSSLVGPWLGADQSSPSEQAQARERDQALAEAMEKVSPDQREAIVLHHFLGMSVGEAAKQMRRTEKAVAGLLLRGRQALREFLPDYP
jgi:RNA polymerase sigma-70 factor (ECF subfamily)